MSLPFQQDGRGIVIKGPRQFPVTAFGRDIQRSRVFRIDDADGSRTSERLVAPGMHPADDLGGKTGAEARYAGWRVAQREGFKAMWAKSRGRPVSEAPNLPDSVLDGLVSSIIIEREQIGPNRYIADLGILFDRARAGEMLGVAGQVRRSAPMLLIPVMISAG